MPAIEKLMTRVADEVQVTEFKMKTRQDVVETVRKISPWLDDSDTHVSDIKGGLTQAKARLNLIKPVSYGKNRNHLDGDVSGLSPYISRGVICPNLVCERALSIDKAKYVEKFIQQVAWREYWQGIAAHNPQWLWQDAESYKTGFTSDDYADDLPEDVNKAQTGVACIDQFLTQLITQGWVHNHVRLYLAAYICHWRRVKWQVGAKFFLRHLLDADLASNNLSWQWVASTFSHKPYYFNLENVQKFSSDEINTDPRHNIIIDASYEALAKRLFPNMPPQ